jgi:hypothetical protein
MINGRNVPKAVSRLMAKNAARRKTAAEVGL